VKVQRVVFVGFPKEVHNQLRRIVNHARSAQFEIFDSVRAEFITYDDLRKMVEHGNTGVDEVYLIYRDPRQVNLFDLVKAVAHAVVIPEEMMDTLMSSVATLVDKVRVAIQGEATGLGIEVLPLHVAGKRLRRPMSFPIWWETESRTPAGEGHFTITMENYDRVEDLQVHAGLPIVVQSHQDLAFEEVSARVRIFPERIGNMVLVHVATKEAGPPLLPNLAIEVAKIKGQPIALIASWLHGYYVIIANPDGTFNASYKTEEKLVQSYDTLPPDVVFIKQQDAIFLSKDMLERRKYPYVLKEEDVDAFRHYGHVYVEGVPDWLWKAPSKYTVKIPALDLVIAGVYLIIVAVVISLALIAPQLALNWFMDKYIKPTMTDLQMRLNDVNAQIQEIKRRQQAASDLAKQIKEAWLGLRNARLFDPQILLDIIADVVHYNMEPKQVSWKSSEGTIMLRVQGDFDNYQKLVAHLKDKYYDVEEDRMFSAENVWSLRVFYMAPSQASQASSSGNNGR